MDECQAIVGACLAWHFRHRSFRDDSRICPWGSWQVVQLKPLGPQIWCGPAICWNPHVAVAR